MNVTVKYLSDSSEEIEESELSAFNTYCKLFYEDGILKRKEIYSDGILTRKEYCLNSESEIDKILSTDPDACFDVVELVNNHRVERRLVYIKNKLASGKTFVFTEKKELICIAEYFSNDSESFWHVSKMFEDESGDTLYQFEYSDEGTCIYIHNLQEVQADIFPPSIGVDPSVEFTWEGMEYYQFSYPIIPES